MVPSVVKTIYSEVSFPNAIGIPKILSVVLLDEATLIVLSCWANIVAPTLKLSPILYEALTSIRGTIFGSLKKVLIPSPVSISMDVYPS